MLNFRNTSIALIVFAALVATLLFFGIRLGMFPLLAIVLYLILLVTGSVNICSGFYIKAFCKGKTDEKLISLTFDDGPDPLTTFEVLRVLKEFKIEAAFFVIGHKAEKHPEIIVKIREEGHTIGIHSYSHAFLFDLFDRKKMERDLVEAGKSGKVEKWNGGMVEKRNGSIMESGMLFRPPYGVTNPTVARVVKRLELQVVGWSVRSLDTTIKDPQKVAARINKRLHPGAVILMHDTRKDLPDILEKVIKNALEKGYRFVGLEEMMKYK